METRANGSAGIKGRFRWQRRKLGRKRHPWNWDRRLRRGGRDDWSTRRTVGWWLGTVYRHPRNWGRIRRNRSWRRAWHGKSTIQNGGNLTNGSGGGVTEGEERRSWRWVSKERKDVVCGLT